MLAWGLILGVSLFVGCSDDGAADDGGSDSGGDGATSSAGSDRCSGAVKLAFDGGKAKASGTTEGAKDEYQTLRCGGVVSLSAPQRYYRFTARAGRAYRITLRSDFSAYLYVFSGASCTFSAVEKSCGSLGETGARFHQATSEDKPRSIVFAPDEPGDYRIAVDSYSTLLEGKFDLTVEEFTPTKASRCASPTQLRFTSGKAVVQGSTRYAVDEFPKLRCAETTSKIHGAIGAPDTYAAPQLYYELSAREDKAYRISLTSKFAAYLYVFPQSANCKTAAIAKACGSGGKSGAVSAVQTNVKQTINFRPTNAGTYLIAIDGSEPGALGDFVLQVEEYTPPPIPRNAKCSAPQAVTLANGTAKVSGDTTAAVDENPTLKCGSGEGPQLGRQLYYKLTARAGKAYRFTVKPQFWANIYLFPASVGCTLSGIDSACKSGGKNGLLASTGPKGTTSVFVFTPPAAGDYIFAVDSNLANEFGKFDITIDETTPPVVPANSKCSSPKDLSFVSGKATVQATTIGAKDELSLTCRLGGGHHIKLFAGPQVYYRFKATAGKIYRLKVKASFAALLYVFDQKVGCTQSAVEKACGSAGETGLVFDTPSQISKPRSIVFAPKTSGYYVVAVDGWQPAVGGPFTLTIEESTPASNAHCASPQPLSFSSGKVQVNTTTSLSSDDYATLRCTASTSTIHFRVVPSFDAPQRYYSFKASSGNGYRVTLTPQYAATFYIFDGSLTCSESNLDGSCGSQGISGDVSGQVSSGSSKTIVFLPRKPGTYVVGVDGAGTTHHGAFQLSIEEFSTPIAPPHGKCKSPKLLSYSSGVASVNDTTIGSTDEYPTLQCGSTATFDARQLYYQFAVQSTKGYEIALQPNFPAQTIVFAKSVGCSLSAIDKACASQGKSGDLSQSVASGKTGTLYFRPSQAGDYIASVDSYAPNNFGSFNLKITEKTLATNDRCSKAQTLTFTSSSATVKGATVWFSDEFSTLSCGRSGFPTYFNGPQVYYRFTAKANKSYTLSLTPDFLAHLVVFTAQANCQVSAINTACGSGGSSGDYSSLIQDGTTGKLVFKPSSSGDYIVAVEGNFASDKGTFSMTVTEN